MAMRCTIGYPWCTFLVTVAIFARIVVTTVPHNQHVDSPAFPGGWAVVSEKMLCYWSRWALCYEGGTNRSLLAENPHLGPSVCDSSPSG